MKLPGARELNPRIGSSAFTGEGSGDGGFLVYQPFSVNLTALGGLSCAAGQIPKIAGGVWTCGDDAGISNVVEDLTPQLGGDLDLNGHNVGTATPAEVGYVHGVTSGIQGQLDAKQAKFDPGCNGTNWAKGDGTCGTPAGGTSVNVNGAGVSNPNFNAATPAAESGYQSAKLQVSGSDVSVEVPLNGPYNVKTQGGAAGDGATDDTTAFSNSLAAAAGGVLWVPRTANGYKITAALTIPANTTVWCEDGAKLIRFTAATDLFDISVAGAAIRGCILDTNGQTGGILVSLASSTRTILEGNTFQGAGNNAGLGWVNSTGATQFRIANNKFLGLAESAIFMQATNADVSYGAISGNYIEGTVVSKYGISLRSNTGHALKNITVQGNRIVALGACFATNTGGSGQFAYNLAVTGNVCEANTGTGDLPLYSLFGFDWSEFSGNSASDNGRARGTQPAFAWHDAHGSTFAGNVARLTSNTGRCIYMLDSAWNTVSGNVCSGQVSGAAVQNGWSASERGLLLAGSASSTQCGNNVISANSFVIPPSFTGKVIEIAVSQANQHCDRNQILRNHFYGTGTANGTAIALTQANGTVDGSHIEGNYIYNIQTGVSLPAGTNNAFIGEQYFDTVSTPIFNAATSTRINYMGGMTYAQANALGTLANGSNLYVSDATISACATPGTGAFMRWLNGAGSCY